MNIEKQQKQILKYLRLSYAGAKAFDDIDTMTRITRAIEAFKLPVSKDAIIEPVKEKDMPDDYRIRKCGDCWEYCDGKCSDCPKTHVVTTNHI